MAKYILEGIGEREFDIATAGSKSQGGQGVFFPTQKDDGETVGVKLYKNPEEARRAGMETKVRYEIGMNLPDTNACPPQGIVTNEAGEFVGFYMRPAEGQRADELKNASALRRAGIDDEGMLQVVESQRQTLEEYNARGVHMLDCNLEGWFVKKDPKTGKWGTDAIDIDGSSIDDGTQKLPAYAIMSTNRDPNLTSTADANEGTVWFSYACEAVRFLTSFPTWGGKAQDATGADYGRDDAEIVRRIRDHKSILDDTVKIPQPVRDKITRLKQEQPAFMQWAESVLHGDVRTPPPALTLANAVSSPTTTASTSPTSAPTTTATTSPTTTSTSAPTTTATTSPTTTSTSAPTTTATTSPTTTSTAAPTTTASTAPTPQPWVAPPMPPGPITAPLVTATTAPSAAPSAGPTVPIPTTAPTTTIAPPVPSGNARTSWLGRTRNNNRPSSAQNQPDNSSYLWAGVVGAAAAGTAYGAINAQKEETEEARYNHAVYGNQAPKPDRTKSTFKVVLSVALCATALYLGVQTHQSRTR